MYTVEKIVNRRINTTKRVGKYEYLVKWDGYPDEQNTWEPIDHLDKVQDLIDQYQRAIEGDNDSKFFDESVSSVIMLAESAESEYPEKKSRKIKRGRKKLEPRVIDKIHRSMIDEYSVTNQNTQKQKVVLGSESNICLAQKIAKSNASRAPSEIYQILQKKHNFMQQTTQPDSMVSGISGLCQSCPNIFVETSQVSQEQSRQYMKLAKHIHILGMRKEQDGSFKYYISDSSGKQIWVQRQFMIRYCPVTLCEFYEKRIVFGDEDEKKVNC